MSPLIKELARDTGMPISILLRLTANAPSRYKVFKITKSKSGTFRTIAQPSRSVKILQNWLVANLLCKLPISPHATAYMRGSSIKRNALAHCASNFVLKVDFKDFFHSITPDDLFMRLEARKLASYIDYDLISNILFWMDNSQMKLSIGAPSSPIVSNAVMFEFDNAVSEYCSQHNVIYTRYADDLTFSTLFPHSLDSVFKKVSEMVRMSVSPNLSINADKIVFSSKKNRRYITGIIINNEGKISLGRDRKRLISAKIHRFTCDMLEKSEVIKLQGHLAFALDIEPDFIRRMMKKYGSETINMIMSVRAQAPQNLQIFD